MSATDTATAPTHLVDLPDGRVLALDEHGDPGGPPVVLLPSAPGSRRFDPDPAATAASGCRLLVVDRPGYGRSSPPAPGVAPTVADLADDVVAALRALGTGPAGVVGWSAGGRVALALAARHPALVRAVALVGTPAPHDEVPWLTAERAATLGDLRADPVAGLAFLAEVFGVGPEGDERATDALAVCSADADLLAADPALTARLEAMLEEAARQGGTGSAVDVVAGEGQPYGYDPATVIAPLTVFCGTADPLAGPAAGRWFAATVGHGEVVEVAGTGHLLVVPEWPRILAAVA